MAALHLRIDLGEIVPYDLIMIKSLGHLCLRTHQLPVMMAFYRDVLGLAVKFGLKHDDGTEFGYYLATGNTTFIEIFDDAGAIKQWGGENRVLKPNQGTFYNHFCLEVTGLEAFVSRLEARGVKVRPIAVGMDHSKQAWINDPDGNAIELMEYTPQSLQL